MGLRSFYATLGIFMTYATLSSAIPTPSSARVCTEYTIPVDVSTEFYTLNFTEFKDSFDVVDWVFDIARRDSSSVFFPITGGKEALSESYTIGATFCTPAIKNGHEGTVLLATHGLGFDRSHWDFAIQPEEYNFVDYAINEGYSVFFYDRLGTGVSSKLSGYTESQGDTHVAVLQSLTRSIRAGEYTGDLGTPSKVVHVGHSFGSSVTVGFLAASPELSDGAILTGISYGGAQFGTLLEGFGLRIADQLVPGKWPGRDTGYVTTVDPFSNAGTFFYNGSYDREIFSYSDDAKQPFSVAELLTIGLLSTDAQAFTGPVMILTGEFDFVVCGGNCNGVLEEPAAGFFNGSSNFTAVIHPDVGHVINLSYNATGAYGVMIDYLQENDL